jgi:1,4-alpha-glucan branching enzyme
MQGKRIEPSKRSGMGAIIYHGGVTFRVWAPFADAVSVTGDFNDWSADVHPLASEGSGYWSVDVDGAGDGDGYKFVVRNGDRELQRIDPYARAVTHSAGHGIVATDTFKWSDEDWRMPSWDELVIYEMHAGTFNDRPGGGPGSFASVIERLDYLRDLGITAIELMPAMEFAADYSWGYNPSHIFAIEEAYGGPNELKRLVNEAHGRGIAVLLDVVYNHLGPSDLDLWQFDGWSEQGKGGAYFYNDWRSATPWGDTRPDYGRPEVRSFIADNARWWLEQFHFDGLRWDATAWIRNVHGNDSDPGADLPGGWGLMQQITADTATHVPWKLHIAEDLRDNPWLVRDVDAGGAGFSSQWDAQFVHPVRRIMSAGDDRTRDMHALRHAIEHRYTSDALRRVIYSESHDEVANGKARLPEEIWPGNAGGWHARKRSTLAAVLVFTAPGIPMIFQGQEILEDAWFHDDDPIDWSREQTYAGIRALYRDLIRLRRNWHGTTRGLRGQHLNVYHVNDTANVLAFHRWRDGGPSDDVVVMVNCSANTFATYRIGFPRPGTWRIQLNSDWSGYSDDFGTVDTHDPHADEPGVDGMQWSATVAIAPYSALILSLDR